MGRSKYINHAARLYPGHRIRGLISWFVWKVNRLYRQSVARTIFERPVTPRVAVLIGAQAVLLGVAVGVVLGLATAPGPGPEKRVAGEADAIRAEGTAAEAPRTVVTLALEPATDGGAPAPPPRSREEDPPDDTPGDYYVVAAGPAEDDAGPDPAEAEPVRVASAVLDGGGAAETLSDAGGGILPDAGASGGGDAEIVEAALTVPPRPAGAERPAWLANAVEPPPADGRPMIALVLDDVGVDRRRALRAFDLPGPLTMSIMTYARRPEELAAAARARGHELLVHVPMEPDSEDMDPGPNVLKAAEAPDTLRERLDWALSRFSGYVGINNHMGSRFTADRDAMRLVLREVRRRGLLFLDSRTTPGSVAAEIAADLGIPFAVRNVFIDNSSDPAEIASRLAETEDIARHDGFAIAIGHPREATIRVLGEWLSDVEGRGFVLVPLSAVVRRFWAAG